MIEREPAQWKVQLVTSVIERIHSSPIVCLVSVSGVPGPQLQSIRAKLREYMSIHVMKNNLLQIALKKAGEKLKGVEGLSEEIDGQMALMLSDMNPFRLFRLLEETKTKMPAKGGEISPEDIEVKAGETSFKPGPIIGELQKAGIPAAIEQGKVIIKKDKLLVKQGETISRDVAMALSKMEIYPLTVGLELRAAYEDGTIFNRGALDIDIEEFYEKLQFGVRSALNLSVSAGIPNTISIVPLLNRAYLSAINLAVNSGYPSKESLKILLAKASAHSHALLAHLPKEALEGDAVEEKKEKEEPSKDDDVKEGQVEEISAEEEPNEKKEDAE